MYYNKIIEAHKAITQIKGKDYAPDVHEIQLYINTQINKTMEKENYFTFLGNSYIGDLEDAYKLYKLSKKYSSFADYLAENYTQINDIKTFLESCEKDFITAQLVKTGYNIQKTAKTIGIHRENLYTKIVNFGIEIPGRQINYSQYKRKN